MALWWLGLAGTVLSVVSFSLLALVLNKMDGNVKRVYIYIFAAAFIYMVAGSLEMIFGVWGIETTHTYWNVVPILYFASAAPWFLGVRTLLDIAEEGPGGGG